MEIVSPNGLGIVAQGQLAGLAERAETSQVDRCIGIERFMGCGDCVVIDGWKNNGW
jgi:hypothetical protein